MYIYIYIYIYILYYYILYVSHINIVIILLSIYFQQKARIMVTLDFLKFLTNTCIKKSSIGVKLSLERMEKDEKKTQCLSVRGTAAWKTNKGLQLY